MGGDVRGSGVHGCHCKTVRKTVQDVSPNNLSYTSPMTAAERLTVTPVPREPRVSKTARIPAEQARRLDAVLEQLDGKKNLTDAIEEGLDMWLAQYED